MRNKSLLPFVLATLLLCAACKDPVAPDTAAPTADSLAADTVPAMLSGDTAGLAYDYFATAFTAQVGGYSVEGTLRMAHDSIIWISATKVIELLRAKMTTDSLFAVVRTTNQYIACSLYDVRRITGMAIDLATAQALLLGRGSHHNRPKATYSDYDTAGGILLPHTVVLSLRDGHTTVTLQYRNIVWNRPTTYPWSVPRNGNRLRPDAVPPLSSECSAPTSPF